MSGIWDEYKITILQAVLIIFSGTMLITGLIKISEESRRTKENHNRQIIEINYKLDRIQADLDILKNP